jgi:hypothetical protein
VQHFFVDILYYQRKTKNATLFYRGTRKLAFRHFNNYSVFTFMLIPIFARHNKIDIAATERLGRKLDLYLNY